MGVHFPIVLFGFSLGVFWNLSLFECIEFSWRGLLLEWDLEYGSAAVVKNFLFWILGQLWSPISMKASSLNQVFLFCGFLQIAFPIMLFCIWWEQTSEVGPILPRSLLWRIQVPSKRRSEYPLNWFSPIISDPRSSSMLRLLFWPLLLVSFFLVTSDSLSGWLVFWFLSLQWLQEYPLVCFFCIILKKGNCKIYVFRCINVSLNNNAFMCWILCLILIPLLLWFLL